MMSLNHKDAWKRVSMNGSSVVKICVGQMYSGMLPSHQPAVRSQELLISRMCSGGNERWRPLDMGNWATGSFDKRDAGYSQQRTKSWPKLHTSPIPGTCSGRGDEGEDSELRRLWSISHCLHHRRRCALHVGFIGVESTWYGGTSASEEPLLSIKRKVSCRPRR